MYKAVFFDLDGTLLPIDTWEFMRSYFGALGAYFAELGVPAEEGIDAVNQGVRQMMAFDGRTLNRDRFWPTFLERMDAVSPGPRDWRTLLDAFYDDVFPQLKGDVQANPACARAVATLKSKGYRLALTTNPLFPPQATLCRMAWAGLDAGDFERVTFYDNSKWAKPSTGFYQENLDALGLDAANVLVVGNDVDEDGIAAQLGCDIWIATDYLSNRSQTPMDQLKHGTMAEFADWCQALPEADR